MAGSGRLQAEATSRDSQKVQIRTSSQADRSGRPSAVVDVIPPESEALKGHNIGEVTVRSTTRLIPGRKPKILLRDLKPPSTSPRQ